MSRARVVSATAAALVAAVSLSACKTERVSVSSGEEQANAESPSASISRDGRYVAFYSKATNLVPNGGHGGDVFLRDRVAGQTSLVTVGTGAGSGMEQISANGRYVVFDSYAALTPDDTGLDRDIFVWDRETGVTTRASVGSGGHEGNANSAIPDIYSDIAISRNGRYVAFDSSSPDLVAGDTNGLVDIFVRDRLAGTTARIPAESTGEPATESWDNSTPVGITQPALSLDGRYVGFASARQTPDFPNPVLRLGTDLYVRNMQTGVTTKLTNGARPDEASFEIALDGDGTHAAFSSFADDLVPGDKNGRADIFVRNLRTGTLRRVPAETTGEPSLQDISDPSLSRSGRFLAFSSGPYTTSNVYVHDLDTGRTRRLSKNAEVEFGHGYNLFPRISADGRFVAWISTDPTVVPDDTNGVADVFVSPGRPLR